MANGVGAASRCDFCDTTLDFICENDNSFINYVNGRTIDFVSKIDLKDDTSTVMKIVKIFAMNLAAIVLAPFALASSAWDISSSYVTDLYNTYVVKGPKSP